MLRPCAAVLRGMTLRALLKKNRDLNGRGITLGSCSLNKRQGVTVGRGIAVGRSRDFSSFLRPISPFPFLISPFPVPPFSTTRLKGDWKQIK